MSSSPAPPDPRRAAVLRETGETRVRVAVDLDGSGQAEISCPVRFLGHMLEQIARHGGVDLTVEAQGDIEVDAHHTVEDVAICLGQALHRALGDHRGIERFGHARCPLDEALADVTLDLSGRSHVVFRAPELPDRVGDLPADLFEHFFVSLSRHLKANLHIQILWGRSGHHMIEATFKAFARALRAASRCIADPGVLPSTKGRIET